MRVPIAGASGEEVVPAQCDAGWIQASRVVAKVTRIAWSMWPAVTSS